MKRLAVLGHPVSHSRSPAMQNAALEGPGLGGEWSYEGIADELVRDLARAGGGTSAEGLLKAVTAEQVRANGYELVVNCTAIGMADEDPFEHLPLDPERLAGGVVVVDLVYAGSESRLVHEARERGATA